MHARTLMIQGTASHVGKTVLVAAICRILSRSGLKVAPFKAQNMSLNSFVTTDGKEIARAQAMQAFAAGTEPLAEMNPILLKPKGKMMSQVILMGRPYADMSAKEYYTNFARKQGIEAIERSLRALDSEFDVIVIEGAGSPAEINLYEQDIANMEVAKIADAPVLLVSDIDRGGVFASLVGTIMLLKPKDRGRVKGFIINKFRGDKSILRPGLRLLERFTNKPVLGVIPYIHDLELPWEDSVSLRDISSVKESKKINIAVLKLPHISNFTDIEPLKVAGANIMLVSNPNELQNIDAVIIPGTKNTVHDLLWLRDKGLDLEIARLRARGTPVIGICGGFQILGKRIIDDHGFEGGRPAEYDGLSMLNIVTSFPNYTKRTRKVVAEIIGRGPILSQIKSRRIRGYEIHMGETKLKDVHHALKVIRANGKRIRPYYDGCVSRDGTVFGTYLHGIFDDRWITNALIDYLAMNKGVKVRPSTNIEHAWIKSLDTLCETVKSNLDLAKILRIAGIKFEV